MCDHSWRQVHEEALFGGSFPVGWECTKCNLYRSNYELTPAGLGGTISNTHRLVGPHGCRSQTSAGKPYTEQIIGENSYLTITNKD